MKQGIILAAGLGSRLKEITKVTPKSLLRIDGQPMLERNIEFMIEAKFKRIIIIVGYMKERFEYLVDKYPEIDIKLVFNSEYSSSNTVSSMLRASEHFDYDSYITTADIYLKSNPYINYVDNKCFYLLRPKKSFVKPDWVAELDEFNQIKSVDKRAYEGYSYTGISFFNKGKLQIIKSKLQMINWENEEDRQRYWDELLLPNINEYDIYAKILEDDSEIYEFDDLSDIKEFEIKEDKKVIWGA